LTCELLSPRYHKKPRCPHIFQYGPDCFEECRGEKEHTCPHHDPSNTLNSCSAPIEEEPCEGELQYLDYGLWQCNSCSHTFWDSELPDPLEDAI
jgi:hypothetical protein